KKMTDISQTQAGFKAKSRGNPLRLPRLFNAKSGCVCRNKLNFRLFRYTLTGWFHIFYYKAFHDKTKGAAPWYRNWNG
uniref:hypothetical protein n=1 Tax=Gemmiger qucibialis TaxID=2997294 RepID=UPI003FEF2E7E